VSDVTGGSDGPDVGESEAVLVTTPVTDPAATLDAASVGAPGGPVLAVLATVPRERFERGMIGAGYDPETVRSVEFGPNVDTREGTVRGGGGKPHGDIAGLSMELVGRLDGLGEKGGVVYLESVGSFVTAAGLESTFRFLLIVAARARAAGIPLVVRLDPESAGPGVAETLVEAFDRTVDGLSGGSGGGTGSTARWVETPNTSNTSR
jgi:hypothetical protein